jgi:hypothetical protein
MSSPNQALNRSNLLTSNWLLDIGISPLPRPPGSLGDCSAGCRESSSANCSVDCRVENPASYPDGNSASHSAGCWASCPASCGESSSPSCSADCPADRPAGNPESSLRSSGADNSPCSPVSSREGSLASCLENSGPASACHQRAGRAVCIVVIELASDKRPFPAKGSLGQGAERPMALLSFANTPPFLLRFAAENPGKTAGLPLESRGIY